MVSKIILIAHNIRSSHNVGSLLRTAEGLGVEMVYLTGYSPYPELAVDPRLPHLVRKQSRQIAKTALGSESLIKWHYDSNVLKVIEELKRRKYTIAALEQTDSAIPVKDFKIKPKIALIVGSEVGGLDAQALAICDVQLHLPMHGRKESFNVAVAAGIALYHLKLKGDGQID